VGSEDEGGQNLGLGGFYLPPSKRNKSRGRSGAQKKIAGKPLGGDLPAIHGKLSRFREPFEAVHFRIPDRL
jgi:hypothetical protein